MSLYFAGSNLKWRTLQFSIFLCIPHIRKNPNSHVIGKKALVQSDCRILWSSIFLEVMHQYFWFFELRKKVSMLGSRTGYYFFKVCPGMPSQAETCLEFPGAPWLLLVFPGEKLLKVIRSNSEWKINWILEGKKCLLSSCITLTFKWLTKMSFCCPIQL